MNKKAMRPLSTKSSTHKPAKSRRRMWLVVIVVLVLIAISYLFSQQSEPESTAPVSESSAPSITEQTEAAQSASVPVDNNQAAPVATNPTTPDSEAILNSPIPENDSLAKEEIDRLADEKQRMAEQDKLAVEQLTMNKQLSNMKDEQIALVEQQIEQELAKLEATEDVKPSAE